MAEGAGYYQEIGQLQKALRERELHRLDLEREQVARLQRREKKYDQLRSKIKALHQELIQEEIESTQRVTLLFSQVDSVQREYELLEARTERLRQKKIQYELLAAGRASKIFPTYLGTSGYGAQNDNERGHFATRLKHQPAANSYFGTPVNSNDNQFPYRFTPFSIPSNPAVYPPNRKFPSSLNIEDHTMIPNLQSNEYLSSLQMPVPKDAGEMLASSDDGRHYYNAHIFYNASEFAYGPQLKGKNDTDASHPCDDNLQRNRNQNTTEMITRKQQFSDAVVNNVDETSIINLQQPPVNDVYKHSNNKNSISGSEKGPLHEQPPSPSSLNFNHYVQAISSQGYQQEPKQPLHHSLQTTQSSPRSDKAQVFIESRPTGGAEFHLSSRESFGSKVDVELCEDDANHLRDLKGRQYYSPGVTHKEVESPKTENLVSEKEIEIPKDQLPSERNPQLEELNYGGTITLAPNNQESANVPESLLTTDEQPASPQLSFTGKEMDGDQDIEVSNDIPSEIVTNVLTRDDNKSPEKKKFVNGRTMERQSEMIKADPVDEKTQEDRDLQRSYTDFTQERPELVSPKNNATGTKRKTVAFKSDKSNDSDPAIPKKTTEDETRQPLSQDDGSSKSSFSQNSLNKGNDDNDSDFFDRDIPISGSRTYKSVLSDMGIGGPILTESDSDDIEGQMSTLAMRDSNSGKLPKFRPFTSNIPSLQPKPPSTDTDSVDSVEAAIQAAMAKTKQDAPCKDQEQLSMATETSKTEAKLSIDKAKEAVPVPGVGHASGVGKTKMPTRALNLKLDSDSDSCAVSGGDNESEDDFDFYD